MNKIALAAFLVSSSLFAQVQVGKNVQIGGSLNTLTANLEQEVALPSECNVGGLHCIPIYPNTVSAVTSRATAVTSPGSRGVIVTFPGPCGGLAACSATVTWGGFSVPAGITTITAIKPFAIYSTNSASFTVSNTTVSPAGTLGNSASSSTVPLTLSIGGTGMTGAQVSSATLQWALQTTVGGVSNGVLNVASIGLILEYTDPIVTDSNIQVVKPLNYNQTSNELSIDPLALSYSVGLKVAGLPAASAVAGYAFPITDGASSSDCTTGGGTNVVWCESNGATWTAFGGGSGSVSGQAAGVVGLGGSTTTIASQSHINENTAGTTTVTQKMAVNDGTGNGGLIGFTFGTHPSVVAGGVNLVGPASGTAYNAYLPGAQGTGALTNDGSGNLSWSNKLPTYTVAGLPSASTLGAGAQAVVTDATSFTPGTCTGGGSDYMIAVSNGTTWSCH